MLTEQNGTPATAPGRGAVYQSALTAVALTWTLRLIGLVSVVILARLLSPRDFGIVGLAVATMALVDIFSALGLRQALLRIKDPQRAHLDTAWTIQLILLAVLALVLLAVAPLAAWFYGEPALVPVIAVLATRFLFYGAVNIGIVDFERNLEFGRDLRMRVSVRLGSLVGTIAAAVLLRSYWALVTGLVLQSALHAAASYYFHPYRPRLSLAKRTELLGVSLWMFLAYAAQVVHHQMERLVIGSTAAMNLVGLYSVSKDLSSIFTQEIATALNRVTFVVTSRTRQPLSEDPERVRAMLGAYAMITAPLGLGLAATAEDAIAVLLGPQWLAAAPLLQLIAPASALYAVYKVISSSFQASSLARTAALVSWCGAAGAAAALLATVTAGGGAIAVATAALAASGAVLVLGIVVIGRVAQTSAFGLAGAIVRPFAAAAAMLTVLRLADLDTGTALFDLALSVAAGAAIYVAAILLLWTAAGRPAGAEAKATALLAEFRHRTRPRKAV